MTRKPTSPNPSSSNHQWRYYSRLNLWLECDGRNLIFIGPYGLFVGLQFASGLKSLPEPDGRHGYIRLTLPTGAKLLAGNIRSWRPLPERNLQTLLRKHPELVRPNHIYYDEEQTQWGYRDGSASVLVSSRPEATTIKFSSLSKPSLSIWRTEPELPARAKEWASFLVTAVLLGSPLWQDPRPWLEFLHRFDAYLKPSFKDQAYRKLFEQFKRDYVATDNAPQVSNVRPHELPELAEWTKAQTARFRGETLLQARRGWWLAHPDVLARLQTGFKPGVVPKSEAILRWARNEALPRPVDLAWFEGCLPLESLASARVDWPPLNLAEYLTFLDNKLQ